MIGIIEHQGKKDQQPEQTAQLHRLNSDFIQQIMLTAGFVLEETSDLLRNENDDLTQGALCRNLDEKQTELS